MYLKAIFCFYVLLNHFVSNSFLRLVHSKNNADLNSINNVEFTCADAGKYMIELVNDN